MTLLIVTMVLVYILYVTAGYFVTRIFLIDNTDRSMPIFLFIISVLFAWPLFWLLDVSYGVEIKPRKR